MHLLQLLLQGNQPRPCLCCFCPLSPLWCQLPLPASELDQVKCWNLGALKQTKQGIFVMELCTSETIPLSFSNTVVLAKEQSRTRWSLRPLPTHPMKHKWSLGAWEEPPSSADELSCSCPFHGCPRGKKKTPNLGFETLPASCRLARLLFSFLHVLWSNLYYIYTAVINSF